MASSRRVLIPSGSNTYPLRSETPTTRILAPLRKIRDHLSQRASDLPESQDKDIDPVARGRGAASHLRKLERRVDCALCRRRVRVFHDDGDIQLGRSLGDRDHVDPGRREGGEDPGGDTASPVHAETDDGNRGYPGCSWTPSISR